MWPWSLIYLNVLLSVLKCIGEKAKLGKEGVNVGPERMILDALECETDLS